MSFVSPKYDLRLFYLSDYPVVINMGYCIIIDYEIIASKRFATQIFHNPQGKNNLIS